MVWSLDGSAGEQIVDGVSIHFVPRRYWPVLERWWPDTRNEWTRDRVAARLDRRHRFDWIEIQSDEGVDHRLQKRFRGRVVLRIHTTLFQMCKYKEVNPTHLTETWLARERRSFSMADKILTHSPIHAAELVTLFPGIASPRIVAHGCGSASPLEFPNEGPEVQADRARFLVVGTLDLRKGTDRLRTVAARYAQVHGACELRLVSPSPESALKEHFGLGPPYPPGVSVRYLTGLSPQDLAQEYRRATAYLHLARYESFGYPLIEAASSGTPVVATRTGIAPDLLGGPLESLLVDGEDPEDCVRAMGRVAGSRHDLGRQIRHAHAERFTRACMTDRYLQTLAHWSATETEAPTHR
jgi:glycosyltransferase involved in cell wall biosynthesis